ASPSLPCLPPGEICSALRYHPYRACQPWAAVAQPDGQAVHSCCAGIAAPTPWTCSHCGWTRSTGQCIDRLPDTPPSTVQQHTLVLRGQAEQCARLLGVAAFHVAQDDDGALAGRETVDHVHDVIPQLAATDDPLRADLVP